MTMDVHVFSVHGSLIPREHVDPARRFCLSCARSLHVSILSEPFAASDSRKSKFRFPLLQIIAEPVYKLLLRVGFQRFHNIFRNFTTCLEKVYSYRAEKCQRAPLQTYHMYQVHQQRVTYARLPSRQNLAPQLPSL